MSTRALRIGIVNLMPRAETYEPYLLRPLLLTRYAIEPVWIRLSTHRYTSSDPQHIERTYSTFERAIRNEPLDGLIVSGAPVEELRFEDVVYWPELRDVLRAARGCVPSTLGLCWGGLALGTLLGLQKRRFPNKLFGAFENLSLVSGDVFSCAHSRHSGFADRALQDAQQDGAVHLIAHGAETGYSIFESNDHRYLAHLGHPEYDALRIAQEWARDRALRRPDVRTPVNVDLCSPQTTWGAHRSRFFAGWLEFVADAARARVLDDAAPPLAYAGADATSPLHFNASR